MAEPFRLAVATFGRVFDVHPAVDALSLTELSETLSRFQVKTDLVRKEERELDRARKAAEVMTRGEAPTGPMAKRIERHVARHSRDPQGVAAALADLEKDIRREAKQDLRLWAPALFVPGARREDDNVVHLSALVLDFDKGPAPAVLRAAFAHVFHIAHSTWSYSANTPKLRLTIPFSAPVRPADFHAIWHYADDLAGTVADPTGRALARAWALPAVPRPDSPRLAWTHEGPLFDPFVLGLAASPEPTPPPAPTLASFVRLDPNETFLGPTEIAPSVASAAFDPWDGGGAAPAPRDLLTTDDAAPDPVLPPRSAPVPAPAAVPVPVPTPVPTPGDDPRIPALQARIDTLEARVAALEKVLSDYL